MTSPVILDFHTAYQGELTVGIIDNRDKKRASDGLVYFISGEVKYHFGDKIFTARAGSVIHLPRGSSYLTNIEGYSKFICVDFDFEYGEPPRFPSLFSGVPSTLLAEFERLVYSSMRSEEWHAAESFGRLYQILAVCLRTERRSYTKSTRALLAAEKYALEHYTESTLTVADMARAADITEGHLRRIFGAKHGISPIKYINHLRTERAKLLLKGSNLTVSQIATLSGFADAYYFSREFKKRVGIPPSEYAAIGP